MGAVSEHSVWLSLKTLFLLNRHCNSYLLLCNKLSQNLVAHMHRTPPHTVNSQSWLSVLSQLPCPSSPSLLNLYSPICGLHKTLGVSQVAVKEKKKKSLTVSQSLEKQMDKEPP